MGEADTGDNAAGPEPAVQGDPQLCPQCGSERIRPILWGYPTDEAFERAERGEFVLGGCVVTPNAPNTACLDCQARWVI